MINLLRLSLVTVVVALSMERAFASVADQPSTTPQDVFDGMRASFRSEKAAGLNARFQFNISGPHGGIWSIEVNNKHCHFARAKIDNPDVTLIVSDNDWVAISNGKLSGVWASLSGRLKVRGNPMLARKLDELFP